MQRECLFSPFYQRIVIEESQRLVHLQRFLYILCLWHRDANLHERFGYQIRSQKHTELERLSCQCIPLLNFFPGEPEGYQYRIRVVAPTASIQKDWSKLVIEIDIVMQGASILRNIGSCLIKR